MVQELLTFIKQEHLLQGAKPVLLAVSGGIDSSVMAHLFHQAGIRFELAHCNFQLREEESERDQAFVQSLAAKLNTNIYTTKFDTVTYSQERKISIQVAARELRYKWLEEIRRQGDFQAIATAHHLQDNVETVLINLCKGTGMAGLHGILPKQGYIIRPILFASREQILGYVTKNEIEFVEDSSNLTDKYTRNFIRHQVLPLLNEVHPGAVQNFGNSIEKFREAELLYREAVNQLTTKLIEKRGTEYFIPVLKLKKTEPLQTIAYELFKPFQINSNQLSQVLGLLESETGKFVQTQDYRIIRDRSWLIVAPRLNPAISHYLIDEKQGSIETNFASIQWQQKSKPEHIATESQRAQLDIDKIKFPLVIRRWRQGDYFYPLGMNKKKKVSKFLHDLKLSMLQKEQVHVLVSGSHIVWVMGYRIDHRFRITDQTEDILEVHFNTL